MRLRNCCHLPLSLSLNEVVEEETQHHVEEKLSIKDPSGLGKRKNYFPRFSAVFFFFFNDEQSCTSLLTLVR